MYHITEIQIINGEKTTITGIKGGFFPTIALINDYQRVLSEYYNAGIRYKLTVYVNYKVPVSAHIPHR